MNVPVGARRNEGLLFGLPLLGVYAVAVVAFFATLRSEAQHALVTNLLLMGLAAVATAASIYRFRQRQEVHKQWLFFAISGFCAFTSHVVWSAGLPSELGAWLLLGSPVAFAVATAIALQEHDQGEPFEVSLDTALVVGAAAIVVFRWAPAAQQVLQAGVDFPLETRASVIVASVTAIASLFFALIPLTESAGPTSIGIAGAAICFALASMPLALEGSDCCTGGNPLALAAGTGWVALTYGALRHEVQSKRQRRAVGWRMRYLIAPGVAVLIAAVLVDAALGPPLLEISAVAMGVTGLVLSLRLSQLLHMSGRRTREQLELAQTRALIQVSNALASETDLNATLGEVTVITSRLLNARAATLELLTEDSRALEVKAAVGLPPEVIGLRVPVIGSFTGSIVREGEARMVVDPSADDQFSEESRKWLGHSPTAGAPLRHRGQPLGVLSVMGEEPFTPDDLELLVALADQASVAIANARLFHQVHALSITDPLTGLANRRQLERDLAREFAAARRGRQLVAVMFDVNGFKAYNDQHGHIAGDQVLRALGDALATHTRAMNLAARYGGDEFVVLLADSEPHGARIFVQRVRQGFDHAIASLGRGGVTIGAGLAAYHPDMKDPEELIAAADAALYEAKATRSST